MRNINLLIIPCLLLLAACAGGIKKQPPSIGNFQGYYKIGEPYQIDGQWYFPEVVEEMEETGIASWYGDDFHGKLTANGDIYDKNSLTAAHRTLPMPSMVRVTNLENNKTLVVMINDRGPFAKGRIIDLSERSAKILGFRDRGLARVRVEYLPGHTKRLLADLPSSPYYGQTFAHDNSGEEPVNRLAQMLAPYEKEDNSKAPIELEKQPDIQAQRLPQINISSQRPLVTVIDPVKETRKKEVAAEEVKEEDAIEKVTKAVHYIQAGTYGVEGNAKRVREKLASLGNVELVPVDINGSLLYRVKVGPILRQEIASLTLEKIFALGHPDAIILTEGR